MASSDRLMELMKERGMTKYRLSKTAGCSATTVTNWLGGAEISPSYLKKLSEIFDVSVDYLMGFGELDLVLPPNMQGANLSGAKIDSQFLNYILSRFSQIDQQNPRYESTRNAVLSIAKSSGLEEMAKSYIFELESRNKAQKEKPTPVSESGRPVNIVKIAGRDGSYAEKRLTDEQVKALQTIIDQMPEAPDDL